MTRLPPLPNIRTAQILTASRRAFEINVPKRPNRHDEFYDALSFFFLPSSSSSLTWQLRNNEIDWARREYANEMCQNFKAFHFSNISPCCKLLSAIRNFMKKKTKKNASIFKYQNSWNRFVRTLIRRKNSFHRLVNCFKESIADRLRAVRVVAWSRQPPYNDYLGQHQMIRIAADIRP